MKVSELYQKLSYGELSNLSMGNDGNGTIAEAAKPRILNYANEALQELYSEFIVKEQDLLLMLHESITQYHLIPPYALSYTPTGISDTKPVRYIQDRKSKPFTGNVMRIISVYDSDGRMLPLNDAKNMASLFTPQMDVLQVPVPNARKALSVMYQASHAKLTGEGDEEIVLPEVLLGGLTSFIGYKVFSHMETAVSTAKAQELYGMFKSVLAKATDKDLVNSSTSTSNERFHLRGWI